MSTKHIAQATLWQVASQVVMAVLSIVTVKLVAVGLSRELAGNYNSAYGFLQIFGILADFGLYAVAVRELSRAEDKSRMLGALMFLRLIILCLSLALALGVVWVVPMWKGTPFPLSVSIAAFVPFFTLLAGIQRTVFQVTYTMHYVFIAEVAQRVLALAIIAAIILLGIQGSNDLWVLHAVLAAGGIAACVLFVLSTMFAQRLIPARLRWDSRLLKQIFLLAAPYGAAYLCVALYRQLDVTLIALLRSDFEIQNAYYGFALRSTDMAYIFPTFLLNSVLPILSERDAKGEDTGDFVGKAFLMVMLLSTTAFLFALLWARPVMQLLTTEAYLSHGVQPGADTALMLLSVPMLLNGVVLFSFYSMLTKHAWRPLVITLALGALFSVGLNLMFIPTKGFIGATYACIGTHIFLSMALLPQALSILPMRLTRIQIQQWLLYTLLLGMLLLLLRPYLLNGLWTTIGLLLAGCGIVAIAYATKLTRALRG